MLLLRVIYVMVTLVASSLGTKIPDEHLIKLVQVLQGLDIYHGIRISGSDKGILARLARKVSHQDISSADLKSLEKEQLWPIVHLSGNPLDLDTFLEVLTHQEYRSEELILVTSYDFSLVTDSFKSINKSRVFLTYQLGQDSKIINRIQTFRDRPLLLTTPWHASTKSQKFDKVYDFQGAPMTLLATVYDYPYLIVVPCENKPHLACQAYGPDVETMSYMMAKYNFTLEIHLEPNNDHGSTPIEGNIGRGVKDICTSNSSVPTVLSEQGTVHFSDDANATYGGILGNLLDDNYDRGSTAWQHTLERSLRAEFSVNCIHIKAHFVMDVDRAVKNDWTLYFRPFTQSLW